MTQAEETIRAVLIAGPTASGKSALAIEIARRLDGVVVNADSMQVYADLRILSARPSEAEEALAPHRLYGHVDGAVNYSAMRYAADVGALLPELWEQGKLPILVGGTGLYFKAVTEGFSAMPPVPEAVRSAFRARAEGAATEALIEEFPMDASPLTKSHVGSKSEAAKGCDFEPVRILIADGSRGLRSKLGGWRVGRDDATSRCADLFV